MFRSNNFDKPGRIGINAVNFGMDIVAVGSKGIRSLVSTHLFSALVRLEIER